MAQRNPPWARDELILALDLYVRAGMSMLPAENADVVELSRVLNASRIHADRPDAARFRNPNACTGFAWYAAPSRQSNTAATPRGISLVPDPACPHPRLAPSTDP
jgi:hypothetical protein